ncbi:MAG TPA: glycoside hydrolase family 5 protein [Polyangiaceae bacterium]|nr:glycoside hydrolase family 5 protein [Polyangiaceae bacterium]
MQRRASCAKLALAGLVLVTACDVGSTSTSGAAAGNSTTAGSTATAGAPASAGGASGSNPAIAGAGSGNEAASGGAGTTPGTPITAKTAAAAMGKGVNLGQMFESTQHPPTLAAASAKIDAYYAKGFRNLRIPVTWTEATNGDTLVGDPAVGDVNRTHPRLLVIEQVVDYALSKPDLYVVLNVHHEVELKTQSRAAVLERLWADIAEIFAQREHRLIFEILNEPHRMNSSAMPAADLRNMTAKAYAKIRAIDPARIVVIGGNQWFAASEVPAVWSDLSGVGGGDDPYVMATFHHYNPWTFCGDNQGTYDDAWTDAQISEPMETMLTWANSVGKGMPVFIGEWGVGWGSRYDAFSCNNIRAWYQKLPTEFAAKRGIPTVVWDDGGWFKIYDHTSNAFANNLADCIFSSCEWEGTERFNAGCQ